MPAVLPDFYRIVPEHRYPTDYNAVVSCPGIIEQSIGADLSAGIIHYRCDNQFTGDRAMNAKASKAKSKTNVSLCATPNAASPSSRLVSSQERS